MSEPQAKLHGLVTELMRDFETKHNRLGLAEDKFDLWTERFSGLTAAERPAVATDLAVLAARFQREAKEHTELAVHALVFFAGLLADSIQVAGKLLRGQGVNLSEGAESFVTEAAKIKRAPKAQTGRSRDIDPAILRSRLGLIR